MKLIVSPVYAGLVPPLTESEYQSLKESIKQNGIWIPIIVNKHGVILDGHHRLRACQELRILPKAVVREFENDLLEKKFVIECNLKRRHLNDYQKGILAKELLKIEEGEAKLRQGTRTDIPTSSTPLLDVENSDKRAMTITAKKVGLESGEQLRKILKIDEQASENVKQQLREGKTTINKVYHQIRNQEKKQVRQDEIKKTQIILPKTISLYNQEFQSAPISDNSISLIITDPLYHQEHLHLYTELGEQASRVLKDGGSLVTYCGHFNIDEVITEIKKSGLKFQWVFSIIHSGPTTRIHSNKVHVGWKPMLWFSKGKYDGGELSDVVYSKYEGKELHEYEQSTKESDYFIKQMTIENEIVYDPFMGSGTFGVSAKNLKRQFIGCEKDEGHYQNARSKISHD